ncbi:acid protease [Cutaneotrichosporon oleaginosum]|uniref:Acid protease n=1 Tax=Cutaneotrichosporon oleaginosum TaxID=879819 RepID=A0A0J0XMY1_9TREE|nr:acid protease [Cutaneotrichosporon oleaginosum]KLT42456.1 acid protease [Cutaneotrichosporon oleaginosum]TXT06975.1 hypothetical protein COLE_06306 [Cutaneotrichosporon oleaginosum]
MRFTIPLFLLFGRAVAEPLLYGIHAIRAEQQEEAAQAQSQVEAVSTSADNATATSAPSVNGTAPQPGNETASTAEIGHEVLILLADGSLALNISVGTPPQHILVSLSLDEVPSDLRLTTNAPAPGPPANVSQLFAPADEVLGSAARVHDDEAVFGNPKAGADEPGAGINNPSSEVVEGREDAQNVKDTPSARNHEAGSQSLDGAAVDANEDAPTDIDSDKSPEETSEATTAASTPNTEVIKASENVFDTTNGVVVADQDLFHPSESTTFQTENRTYGNLLNNGTIAADTVTIGTVSLIQQPFMLQSASDAAGRLSLGIRGDSASLGSIPLYRALETHWPSPTVGLFVAPLNNATPPVQNAGELTLGGLNPALYKGEMMYMDVLRQHWALPFTYLGMGFKPVMVNGTYTVDTHEYNAAEGVAPRRRSLDETPVAALWLGTGSLLHPELSDALLAGVPGTSRITTGTGTRYTVPCETNATLTFTVGGYNFSLPPANWIYNVPGVEGACAAYFKAIQQSDRDRYGFTNDTLVVFGLNALSTVYTAFHVGNGTGVPQLGFAALSDAARGVVPGSSPDVPIPGASEAPTVTGTGAGVNASVPAVTAPATASRAVANIGAMLFAAGLVLVVL